MRWQRIWYHFFTTSLNFSLLTVNLFQYTIPNALTTFVPPVLLIITSTLVRNEVLYSYFSFSFLLLSSSMLLFLRRFMLKYEKSLYKMNKVIHKNVIQVSRVLTILPLRRLRSRTNLTTIAISQTSTDRRTQETTLWKRWNGSDKNKSPHPAM